MPKTLIHNATIINEGKSFIGFVLIENEFISDVNAGTPPENYFTDANVINANRNLLFPGVIDTHVHFREPGLTEKACIATESKAALAGGVTSFVDMPNTIPTTNSIALWEEKMEIAKKDSYINYNFFISPNSSNIKEINDFDASKICGVKMFLGNSTGNLKEENSNFIEEAFKNIKLPIVAHCEDDEIIAKNTEAAKEKYGNDFPADIHAIIRNEEACYKSSEYAVNLAKKYGTRLHIAHISTEKELKLLDNSIPLSQKKITAEVCPHHLHFSSDDYAKLGNKLKVNPAVKSLRHKNALLKGLVNNEIDIIATDHAPHLLESKLKPYFESPSGMPMIQHSLQLMMNFVNDEKMSIEMLVDKMCHAPAICFNIKNRGFIKKGYFADLVIFNKNKKEIVKKENILYKCKWSAIEGLELSGCVEKTFVNGMLAFDNGNFAEQKHAMPLTFNRN